MILITGATGFIGSRMAEKFHAIGDELVLLGRLQSEIEKDRGAYLCSPGLHVVDVDLTEQNLNKYT